MSCNEHGFKADLKILKHLSNVLDIRLTLYCNSIITQYEWKGTLIVYAHYNIIRMQKLNIKSYSC